MADTDDPRNPETTFTLTVPVPMAVALLYLATRVGMEPTEYLVEVLANEIASHLDDEAGE